MKFVQMEFCVLCERTGVSLLRHNRTLFIMDEKIQILPLCKFSCGLDKFTRLAEE